MSDFGKILESLGLPDNKENVDFNCSTPCFSIVPSSCENTGTNVLEALGLPGTLNRSITNPVIPCFPTTGSGRISRVIDSLGLGRECGTVISECESKILVPKNIGYKSIILEVNSIENVVQDVLNFQDSPSVSWSYLEPGIVQATVSGTVGTTDDLREGVTNLYFTDLRVENFLDISVGPGDPFDLYVTARDI